MALRRSGVRIPLGPLRQVSSGIWLLSDWRVAQVPDLVKASHFYKCHFNGSDLRRSSKTSASEPGKRGESPAQRPARAPRQSKLPLVSELACRLKGQVVQVNGRRKIFAAN